MSDLKLYEAVVSFMDAAGRHYHSEVEGNESVVAAEIAGDDGTWKVYIQITEDEEVRRIVVHSPLPAIIPEHNRLKVAELLTRINYDLIIGNFELGLDDGLVLFKTTLDLADGQLTQAMFERMYELNGHTMNKHYATLLSVGFGDTGQAKIPAEDTRPEGVMLQ